MILALALVVSLQEPAPPTTTETPPTTTETPTTPTTDPEQPRETTTTTTETPNPLPSLSFPEPTPAERGVLPPTPPPTASSAGVPAASTPTTPTETMDLPYYLSWYGAEYAGIAIAAGVLASGVHKTITPAPALIGPQFDLDNPDLAVLFDPRLDDAIGHPLVKEKVPDAALGIGAAVVLLGAAGIDTAVHTDVHRTHALLLGGTEAMLGTVVVTEVLKLSVGRLRPDFRERWLRAACAGNTKAPDDLDCSSVDDGFEVKKEDLTYGMESFPSGHSSTGFAAATFTSLWIGSELVWNDDAPSWGPAVGALAIGTLYTTAGAVAASRIDDNRHHPEDVVAGAALGATLGATAFLVHFDIDGKARHRSWNVVPTTSMGATGTGNGLALVGSF